MAQTQLSLFLDVEELARRIVLWKIYHAQGAIITLSPKDLRKILKIDDHWLATKYGRLLAKWAREGLIKPVRFSRPRSYIVTSKLLEHLFNLKYGSIRDDYKFAFSRLHVHYLLLKMVEARKNGTH